MGENRHEHDPAALLEAPLDPRQLAMHGLLCVYYERDEASVRKRWDAILHRASLHGFTRDPKASTAVVAILTGRRRMNRWVMAIGGLGLAAALMIAVSLFWPTRSASADIYTDAANAGSAWFRLIGSLNYLVEPDSPDALEAKRQLAKYEQLLQRDGKPVAEWTSTNPRLNDYFANWQAYYCLLRDLGRREDAVREARSALQTATEKSSTNWIVVFLDGLGNIHAAYGEYDAARAAYHESIELRRKMFNTDWQKDPHYGEPGYEGHQAWHLTPMYLRLMRVAMAEGDLAEARAYLDRTARTVSQRFRTICELVRISAPPGDASLWEAWLALPEEYQRPRMEGSFYASPPENATWSQLYKPDCGLPAWVRTVFYHEVLLLRAEGRYADARQVLERSASIPDYPECGEFPLPFLECLERARLDIIDRDYRSALSILESCKRSLVGPRQKPTEREPEVNRLPLSVVQSAEVSLLEGIARLALEPGSAEGRRLVERAATVANAISVKSPNAQQVDLLLQIKTWNGTNELAQQ